MSFGNKHHFSLDTMSYVPVLTTPVYWERLTQTCREKIQRGARSVEVLQQLSAMQVVETYCDVEAVLLDNHIDVYWGRFVVFISWLHRHRLAYHFWRHHKSDLRIGRGVTWVRYWANCVVVKPTPSCL